MRNFIENNQKGLIVSAALVSTAYIWYSPALLYSGMSYLASYFTIKQMKAYLFSFLQG
jgi:hypothetical protein